MGTIWKRRKSYVVSSTTRSIGYRKYLDLLTSSNNVNLNSCKEINQLNANIYFLQYKFNYMWCIAETCIPVQTNDAREYDWCHLLCYQATWSDMYLIWFSFICIESHSNVNIAMESYNTILDTKWWYANWTIWHTTMQKSAGSSHESGRKIF